MLRVMSNIQMKHEYFEYMRAFSVACESILHVYERVEFLIIGLYGLSV